MNALSYVASEWTVQLAFLGLVAFTIGAVLTARGKRRSEEIGLRKEQFQHQAKIELKRLDAELNSLDGKAALPAPRPGDGDGEI